MTLAKFKYTGGTDTGVNADKQKAIYGMVFPVGKAVEVPDDVAHKLRTKAGNPNDEFVEVSPGSVEKSHAEVQREEALKEQAAAAKKEKPPTPEEIAELKKLAEVEKARVAQVQNDAKLGR